MTASPKIDVRDLKSVREAWRSTDNVVLGDDLVAPNMEKSDRQRSRRRRRFSLRRSQLARKIVTFNLVALIVLVAGMFFLNPARENLAYQRGTGLIAEAELVADVIEAQLPLSAPVDFASGDGANIQEIVRSFDLRGGVEVYIFSPQGALIERHSSGNEDPPVAGLERETHRMFLTAALSEVGEWISMPFNRADSQPDEPDITAELAAHVDAVLSNGTLLEPATDGTGKSYFRALTPVMQNTENPVGVVALVSQPGELDALVARDREQLLKMFLICVFVSIVLSLVLASTIAAPLAHLAEAAELGHDPNARRLTPDRIRIPDLTARPDEIGRLSGALRGMVAALTDRIESNEQFAADVAHEIKNPLASLRSAVGTMRVAKRADQQERLLQVIEQDVDRLDRLVSEISNASRLDAELVKESEKPFDLISTLQNISEHHGREAADKGVDFITDFPDFPVEILGLENRLAQVFVNLISNAISFCEDGDAIRVWVRKRENRALVVVEDTGPGIPEDALQKIFQRFYSERPEQQFGENSGLGLAISKQIVEAHGGVIWAENILPTDADPGSDPLGARFVVGLPL